MLITKNAALVFSRIVVSCLPLKDELFGKEQQGLIKDLKSEDKIDLKEFAKVFLLEKETYQDIVKFAKSLGKNLVDRDMVLEFFGGRPHLQKIVRQIRNQIHGKKLAQQFLFAHILIPVEIVSAGEKLSGIYRNGNSEFSVKNLVPFPEDAAMSVGQKVLVHYAAVITTEFDRATEEKILKDQANQEEFISACEHLGEIDYSKFMNLCEGTQTVVKNWRFKVS